MPVLGQTAGYGGRYTRVVGESGSTAQVDAGSQALRTGAYDTNGVELAKVPIASYMLPIQIRQTTAAAAGSTVWMMAAGVDLNLIYVRRIYLQMAFDGMVAAATTVNYHVCRGVNGSPTTGTVLVPIHCSSASNDSKLDTCQYLDTGLDTTGLTFEVAFAVLSLPLTASAVGIPVVATIVSPPIGKLDLELGDRNDPNGGFVLGSKESLAIRVGGLTGGATVVGISLSGYVLFDERPA